MAVYMKGDRIGPIVATMPVDFDEDEFVDARMTVGNYTVVTTYDAETATATGDVSDPPADYPDFPSIGIVPVRVAWVRADGSTRTSIDESIVIDSERRYVNRWGHTVWSARAEWTTTLSDVALYRVLEAAAYAVSSFAGDRCEILSRHLLDEAQLMQARNLANASKASPSTGDLGDGSYALAARPLDWHVKQLLRPQRGRPLVG